MTIQAAADPTVRDLTLDEAQLWVTHVSATQEAARKLIVTGFLGRVWLALGYESWDAMVAGEFDGAVIRLPREERRELVGSLREAGLSTRAIGTALGAGDATVRRDLQDSGASFDAPRIQGADGKSYASHRPEPTPPTAGLDFDEDIADAEVVDDDPEPDPYRPPPPRSQPVTPALSAEDRALLERLDAGGTVVVRLHSMYDPYGTPLLRALHESGRIVRIDRGSAWGNPFVLNEDGDRAQVIWAYEQRYLPFKPSLMRRLDELRGKALACWCSPQPCHGDVLVHAAQRGRQ